MSRLQELYQGLTLQFVEQQQAARTPGSSSRRRRATDPGGGGGGSPSMMQCPRSSLLASPDALLGCQRRHPAAAPDPASPGRLSAQPGRTTRTAAPTSVSPAIGAACPTSDDAMLRQSQQQRSCPPHRGNSSCSSECEGEGGLACTPPQPQLQAPSPADPGASPAVGLQPLRLSCVFDAAVQAAAAAVGECCDADRATAAAAGPQQQRNATTDDTPASNLALQRLKQRRLLQLRGDAAATGQLTLPQRPATALLPTPGAAPLCRVARQVALAPPCTAPPAALRQQLLEQALPSARAATAAARGAADVPSASEQAQPQQQQQQQRRRQRPFLRRSSLRVPATQRLPDYSSVQPRTSSRWGGGSSWAGGSQTPGKDSLCRCTAKLDIADASLPNTAPCLAMTAGVGGAVGSASRPATPLLLMALPPPPGDLACSDDMHPSSRKAAASSREVGHQRGRRRAAAGLQQPQEQQQQWGGASGGGERTQVLAGSVAGRQAAWGKRQPTAAAPPPRTTPFAPRPNSREGQWPPAGATQQLCDYEQDDAVGPLDELLDAVDRMLQQVERAAG